MKLTALEELNARLAQDSFKICSISQILRLFRTGFCLFWDVR